VEAHVPRLIRLLSQVRVHIPKELTVALPTGGWVRLTLPRLEVVTATGKRLKVKRRAHRLSREERVAVEARLAQLGIQRLLIRSARPNDPTNRSQQVPSPTLKPVDKRTSK